MDFKRFCVTISDVTMIEKFGKDSFHSWKPQIEAALIKSHYWDYITVKEVKLYERTAEEKKQLEADRKAWANIIPDINPSNYVTISIV